MPNFRATPGAQYKRFSNNLPRGIYVVLATFGSQTLKLSYRKF